MRRFTVAALVAAAFTASAACSSSSGGSAPNAGSCTWPTGSVAGYALALGRASASQVAGLAQHDRLLAFDVATGRVVGDCATTPGQLPQPTQLSGRAQYPYGPRSYPTAGLPLPTGRPRLVPDNTYRGAVLHGGVRTLSDGTVASLSFTGWRVVATSGTSLLLTRDSGASTPYRTAPADWCVLPSVDAARSRCARLAAATAPGTGGIAPDGTIHWTPLAGATTTVDGVTLTVGRAGDGTVTAADGGPIGTGTQLPTGLDQRSIVFLPGVPGPGADTVLRWLAGPDPASAAATMYATTATGDAVDAVSDPPFVAAAIDGGAHLVTVGRLGQAVEYTTGQAGRPLVRLRVPAGVLDLSVLSWPSTQAATGT